MFQKFQDSLLHFSRKAYWDYDRDFIEFMAILGGRDIFTEFSFLICELGISFHLFLLKHF